MGNLEKQFYDLDDKISFEFHKYHQINLLTQLKQIYACLNELYRTNCYNQAEPSIIAPFWYEKGDYFYIRAFINLKKNITLQFEDEPIETFVMPRIGMEYQNVTIHIKNVWEQGDKAGFNIELNSVKIVR